jgi:CheY-like chemotaxis protein
MTLEQNLHREQPMHCVLVVDDFPDAAEIACTLLTMYGHECHAACCGKAALELAHAHPFDIAIVDIGLPDLSGYEVARALRADFGAAMYLAAITGWGQVEDRVKALAAGFDQHVLKPIDSSRLRGIISCAEAARDQT